MIYALWCGIIHLGCTRWIWHHSTSVWWLRAEPLLHILLLRMILFSKGLTASFYIDPSGDLHLVDGAWVIPSSVGILVPCTGDPTPYGQPKIQEGWGHCWWSFFILIISGLDNVYSWDTLKTKGFRSQFPQGCEIASEATEILGILSIDSPHRTTPFWCFDFGQL